MAALRPFAPDEGAYVNFEFDADAERVRASYGEQKYRRLAALKAHVGSGERLPVQRQHHPAARRDRRPLAAGHHGRAGDRAQRLMATSSPGRQGALLISEQ